MLAMRLLSICAMVALSACTPAIMGATPRGGIVKNYAYGPAEALQRAQDHCAKYGLVARVSGESEWNDHMMFDCVPAN